MLYVQTGYVEQGYIEGDVAIPPMITKLNYIIDRRVFEKDYGDCGYAVGYTSPDCELQAQQMKMFISDGTHKTLDDLIASVVEVVGDGMFCVYAPEFGVVAIGNKNFNVKFITLDNLDTTFLQAVNGFVATSLASIIDNTVRKYVSNIMFNAKFVLDGNEVLAQRFKATDTGIEFKVPDEFKCGDYVLKIAPDFI